MKQISFLAGFLFISVVIYAQDSSFNLKKMETFKLPNFKIKKIPFTYSDDLKTNNVTESITILKSGTVILPLDNMRCFVPDITSVSKIPNKYYDGSAIKIPTKKPGGIK